MSLVAIVHDGLLRGAKAGRNAERQAQSGIDELMANAKQDYATATHRAGASLDVR